MSDVEDKSGGGRGLPAPANDRDHDQKEKSGEGTPGFDDAVTDTDTVKHDGP
ncbi:MAG: hypothetical protein V7704_06180 [Aurantimonas endophytica]|uniref:hypothetical protein n=1 Tax=Aurantimonas endophytica TaxID=1522175 RepID=UPI0030039C10